MAGEPVLVAVGAVDIVALWGLCAYGRRENLEAAA
jgi:hypothetical protein